jgi:hypothetical protein
MRVMPHRNIVHFAHAAKAGVGLSDGPRIDFVTAIQLLQFSGA